MNFIPSIVESPTDYVRWYSADPRPFRSRQNSIYNLNLYIIGKVVVLFGIGRPSAISNKVSELGVVPLDGESFRAFSHVIKKSLERIPFFTHGNACASVSLKIIMVFIAASLVHCLPNSIGSAIRHAVRNPAFSLKTPARFRVTRPEMNGGNHGFTSAFAMASPSRIFLAGLGRLTNYGQAVKFVSDVQGYFHRCIVDGDIYLSNTFVGWHAWKTDRS